MESVLLKSCSNTNNSISHVFRHFLGFQPIVLFRRKHADMLLRQLWDEASELVDRFWGENGVDVNGNDDNSAMG